MSTYDKVLNVFLVPQLPLDRFRNPGECITIYCNTNLILQLLWVATEVARNIQALSQ